MKKILLLTTIVTIFTTAVFSQNFSTAPTDNKQEAKQDAKTVAANDWQKKVTEDLKLSPDQIAKWETINKEFKVKIDAVMNDATLEKADQKEKKMALKKEKESAFMEILTEEQQAKYKALMERKKKADENAKKASGG